MNPQKRQAIFAQLRAANPNPTTELEYRTPFQLLVAVVLSAQATDRSVNLATRRLFDEAGTPQAVAALGEEGLVPYIRTIGLFRTKAANVARLARIVVEQHGGEVPRSREALEALPGVGRKTANVVLNTAFGEPTIAVDTHIFRVANRNRAGAGRQRRRGRAAAGEVRSRRVPQGRAPLADPAWPLRVQGAQARVLALRHRGLVRVPAEDAGARLSLQPRRAGRSASQAAVPTTIAPPTPAGARSARRAPAPPATR